ncbi:LLM class flavin-dependent oxidoreductase, partial [Actinospica durhamensis]
PGERSDRFEEACQVIVSLLTRETTTFAGTHYTLTDARCDPKPVQRPHPPICIGGSGEKRTLRTVARYAQHWNFDTGGIERFVRARDVLWRHCDEVGRDRGEIRLSCQVPYHGDAAATADIAAQFGGAGAQLAIVYLPQPYTAAVLEPLAQALRKVG